MRLIFAVLLAVLLTGCEQGGRYQIAAMSGAAGVWRVDTKTGEVVLCGVEIPPLDGKVKCVASVR